METVSKRRTGRTIVAAAAIAITAVTAGRLSVADADTVAEESAAVLPVNPVFMSINPCRLVDTRSAAPVGPKTSPMGPAEIHTVTARGANGECTGPSSIPSNAIGQRTSA